MCLEQSAFISIFSPSRIASSSALFSASSRYLPSRCVIAPNGGNGVGKATGWVRCMHSGSPDGIIHSLNNPRVKATRALMRRRARDKERKILIEGTRLVLDALEAGLQPDSLFYTRESMARGVYGQKLSEIIEKRAANKDARTIAVSEQVMLQISDTVSPQGCVAVLPQPALPLPCPVSFLLVCDSVRDPGNVGTLMRSAAGAGVDGVILTSGCADVWSLKALRAGMGAQFRLPIISNMKWPTLSEYLLCKYKCSVCVADGESSNRVSRGNCAAASVHYADYDWTMPSALVVGSEADGPSADAQALAQYKVSIPLSNDVESLNAAVAGAVILFEARRQRRTVTSKSTLC